VQKQEREERKWETEKAGIGHRVLGKIGRGHWVHGDSAANTSMIFEQPPSPR